MSKTIPKNVIDDIRSANDIVELIGTYLQLKRAGSTFKALCPFHKEKTPSFNVNPQRQIYHCFGCGAGGDVISFLMAYENMDFSAAVRMLAERAGIRLEWSESEDGNSESGNKDILFKIHEEVAMAFHRSLLTKPEAKIARDYLESRDLDEQTTKDFLIGYAPNARNVLIRWAKQKGYSAQLMEASGLVSRDDQGRHYDRFRHRLMFPIRNESGRIVGFSGRLLEKNDKLAKYVNTPETVLFKKGRLLYALDRAKRDIIDTKTAILCEGQIDVIRCHVAGITTAVAAQGTALTEDHARLLKRYCDSVIVVLDSDKAGQNASLRSAEILLTSGLSVMIASLPEGDDPDSLIRKQGPDAFNEVARNARPIIEFQADLLAKREDLRTEVGRFRATQALLETIVLAPTEGQRAIMVAAASKRLNIPIQTLSEDLRQKQLALKRRHRNLVLPTAKPADHPPEEIALAEILSAHPQLAGFVRSHLPISHLTDPACRMIVQAMLDWPDGEEGHLISDLANADDECRRLAAQIQMAPAKQRGSEFTSEMAAKDTLIVIWRKALERRRDELRRRMEHADDEERRRLSIERTQLTLDIKTLQQGWDKALPLIEIMTAQ